MFNWFIENARKPLPEEPQWKKDFGGTVPPLDKPRPKYPADRTPEEKEKASGIKIPRNFTYTPENLKLAIESENMPLYEKSLPLSAATIELPKVGDVYESNNKNHRFVVLNSGFIMQFLYKSGFVETINNGDWDKLSLNYKLISRNQRVIVSVENDELKPLTPAPNPPTMNTGWE